MGQSYAIIMYMILLVSRWVIAILGSFTFTQYTVCINLMLTKQIC